MLNHLSIAHFLDTSLKLRTHNKTVIIEPFFHRPPQKYTLRREIQWNSKQVLYLVVGMANYNFLVVKSKFLA